MKYIVYTLALMLAIACGTHDHIPGPQGKPGLDGTNGTNGKDGTNGAKGDKGSKGDTGAQGLPGQDAKVELVKLCKDDTSHAYALCIEEHLYSQVKSTIFIQLQPGVYKADTCKFEVYADSCKVGN